MAHFTAARVFAALILAAAVLPAAANAAEPATEQSVATVSTDGMDLSSAAAQAQLHHRIAVAAHKVCARVMEGDALMSPGYAECFGHATADARAQADRQIALANTRAMVASIATK